MLRFHHYIFDVAPIFAAVWLSGLVLTPLREAPGFMAMRYRGVMPRFTAARGCGNFVLVCQFHNSEDKSGVASRACSHLELINIMERWQQTCAPLDELTILLAGFITLGAFRDLGCQRHRSGFPIPALSDDDGEKALYENGYHHISVSVTDVYPHVSPVDSFPFGYAMLFQKLSDS